MGIESEEQVTQSVKLQNSNQQNVSGDIEGKFKQIDRLFIAVIVVLTLGFITLLITVAGLAFAYLHDSQDMYKQARDQTQSQNDKIDSLIKSLGTKQ